MVREQLSERLALARSKGGANATLWWIAKKATRTEPFAFLMTTLGRHTHHPAVGRFRPVVLRAVDDMRTVPARTIESVSENSGRHVETLLASGIHVYVLIEGEHVVGQLNIAAGPTAMADFPAFTVHCTEKDAFLSYLFTRPASRRSGAARELLRFVEYDLTCRGFARVLTHVMKTNVPSLGTFKKAGWGEVGFLLSDRRGRLLFSHVHGAPNLDISRR